MCTFIQQIVAALLTEIVESAFCIVVDKRETGSGDLCDATEATTILAARTFGTEVSLDRPDAPPCVVASFIRHRRKP